MKIPESLAEVFKSDEYKAVAAALSVPLQIELNGILRDTFLGALEEGAKPWRCLFDPQEDAA